MADQNITRAGRQVDRSIEDPGFKFYLPKAIIIIKNAQVGRQMFILLMMGKNIKLWRYCFLNCGRQHFSNTIDV